MSIRGGFMDYKYSSNHEVHCVDTGEDCLSSDYLNTRHWRRIRQYVYDKNEGVCERCRGKFESAHMNVHHKTYAHIGDERENELCLLCEKCHAIVHGNMANEQGKYKEEKKYFIYDKNSKRINTTQKKKHKPKAHKCNTCKYLIYGSVGRGAGYKCIKRNKVRHYLYTCVCDKFERK